MEKEERVRFVSNYDAEAAVLSVCLIEGNTAVAKALARISAGDFYRPAHRVIFEAMTYLYSKSRGVDPITVGHVLSAWKKINEVGGKVALLELHDQTLRCTDFDYYIELVKQASDQRKITRNASVILDRSSIEQVEHADFIAEVRARAEEILAVCRESGY